MTQLLIKVWRQLCSQPNSLDIYFKKWGCCMSTTGEYDQLVFPQKLSSDDYLFLYDYDEYNVVDLIHTTTYSSDTPDAEMP